MLRWPSIPLDGLPVERNKQINDCLRYQSPLLQDPAIYQLYDYSTSFMVRVVMPKKVLL